MNRWWQWPKRVDEGVDVGNQHHSTSHNQHGWQWETVACDQKTSSLVGLGRLRESKVFR